MRSLRRGMNIVLASALLLAPALGWSGEVALQCSTAMRTVMQDLIPKFERASGHKVTVEYGVTLLMQKDIAAGKVFDVGVMLGGPFDELQRDGKFVPGTRVQLARFGQAVGMHAGGRKYDIGNVAGFRQMLLESGPIAISSGSSGVYFLALLQRLGLTEAVKPKLLSLRSADEVGEAITARRAELAILPISELLPIKDGAVLGPYPEELQEYMYSVGGISSTAAHLGPARELLQFIADPAHRAVYSSKGLQPLN